jgi:16S rRNA (adenine1518-N6/adenine1519-N6)-dimethyltransferase
LSDPRILARIADALETGPDDVVLEIGPGHGGLTGALLGRAGQVIAIEKDRDLVPALQHQYPHARIIEGDALELDWHQLVTPPYVVAGNIPYNITTPLLEKALLPPFPKRIVFLVQKEVAERVAAVAGSAEYGALSIGIQLTARVERLFTVPAGAFQPKPKVDSAVLRLSPLADSPLLLSDRSSFRSLVVGLFGFRRKQMLRGLRELTGWEPSRVSRVLAGAEIPETARPEVVPPLQFLQLHATLVDEGWHAR